MFIPLLYSSSIPRTSVRGFTFASAATFRRPAPQDYPSPGSWSAYPSSDPISSITWTTARHPDGQCPILPDADDATQALLGGSLDGDEEAAVAALVGGHLSG